jgi:cellulose synthase/poly-beta-1,6-N-acetylglucosamine synthase-like glycosyltransferase
MMWITALLLILYVVAIGLLVFGFLQLKSIKPDVTKSNIAFSIVVPFRNERDQLPLLWKSVASLDYPRDRFEILFVDDASEDDSEAILEALGGKQSSQTPLDYRILENERQSGSPKKDAITTAIKQAKYPWILTLDADCQAPATLLTAYCSGIETSQCVLLCGPVLYQSNTSLLQRFQQYDGLTLQLVATGGFGLQRPILCNGANMVFMKSAFYEVGGYEGNNHIASGDDIFLLEKMRREFPDQIGFLKSTAAIVETRPQPNWGELILQRVRWASKTSKQKNWATKMLASLVLAVNILLVLGIPVLFVSPNTVFWWLPFVCIKLIVDILSVVIISGFFGRRIAIFPFVMSSLLYPFIIISVWLRSIGGGYEWKGRTFGKTI